MKVERKPVTYKAHFDQEDIREALVGWYGLDGTVVDQIVRHPSQAPDRVVTLTIHDESPASEPQGSGRKV